VRGHLPLLTRFIWSRVFSFFGSFSFSFPRKKEKEMNIKRFIGSALATADN
jgi:hypothetical protein